MKLTDKQLAKKFGVSVSTLKRNAKIARVIDADPVLCELAQTDAKAAVKEARSRIKVQDALKKEMIWSQLTKAQQAEERSSRFERSILNLEGLFPLEICGPVFVRDNWAVRLRRIAHDCEAYANALESNYQ